MTIDAEQARGLTDRIALAHDLLELGGRFEIEAQHWTTHPSMRHTHRTLVQSSRVLDAYGRQTIRGDATDPAVAEAYRDAALDLLRYSIAKRRRLEHMRATRRQLEAQP